MSCKTGCQGRFRWPSQCPVLVSVSADPLQDVKDWGRQPLPKARENERRRKANVSRWDEWSKKRGDLLAMKKLRCCLAQPSVRSGARSLWLCCHARVARTLMPSSPSALLFSPPTTTTTSLSVARSNGANEDRVSREGVCADKATLSLWSVRPAPSLIVDRVPGMWSVRATTPVARGSRVQIAYSARRVKARAVVI